MSKLSKTGNHMKQFLVTLSALVLFQTTALFAKDGYKIKIKFTDVTDSTVFLAHYYGKPLPTIYKTDSAKLESRFVYELQFEVSQTASVMDAEKMFFIFYDGFKQSKYTSEVKALQHHTGEGFQYKIMAYTDNWNNINLMLNDAQHYFGTQYPEIMTGAWPMVHTGDAIYAVRTSADEGMITQ